MEFCIKSWWFAPKGTPKEAIDGFAAALGKSMETDVVKKFNSDRYFTPVFLSGGDLMNDLNSTWKAIEPVAKLAKKK